MTTIAYRGGIVASDSRASSGSNIMSDFFRKIGRFPDHGIYAQTGDVAKTQKYIASVMAGKPDTRVLGFGDAVLVVDKYGSVSQACESGITELDPTQFYAWGSGAQAALAAMHMGADAKTAVKIAAKIDMYTGGKIHAFKGRAAP